MQPKLIDAQDVAKLLGIKIFTVYKLAQRGALPSYKIGGSRRFRRSDIEEWLLSQKHGETGASTR
jgi:excisionase family DNA binding protein